LSLVVSRAAKRPFGAFLRDEIFVPLGMASTVVFEAPGQTIPGRATGYAKKGGRFVTSRLDTPVTGDGSVFTNLQDLARWLAAWRDKRLLRPETAALAVASGALDSGEPTGYGYGWTAFDVAGRRAVGHGGSWSGTSTHVARLVDDDLTVVVLSNDEDFEADEAASEVARRFLP
jgi:CubicO group peptidase (beta-lactamase class C family)